MDGTTVLRETGPRLFGYRRKDSSYELVPNHDGFEVLRRGKVVWSYTAEGKDGDYHE